MDHAKVVYDNGAVVVIVYARRGDRVCISIPLLGNKVNLTLDELNDLTEAVNEAVGRD